MCFSLITEWELIFSISFFYKCCNSFLILYNIMLMQKGFDIWKFLLLWCVLCIEWMCESNVTTKKNNHDKIFLIFNEVTKWYLRHALTRFPFRKKSLYFCRLKLLTGSLKNFESIRSSRLAGYREPNVLFYFIDN